MVFVSFLVLCEKAIKTLINSRIYSGFHRSTEIGQFS